MTKIVQISDKHGKPAYALSKFDKKTLVGLPQLYTQAETDALFVKWADINPVIHNPEAQKIIAAFNHA